MFAFPHSSKAWWLALSVTALFFPALSPRTALAQTEPDLVVSDINFTTTPTPGVVATLRNGGTTSSGPFNIRWFVDGVDSGYGAHASLAPGDVLVLRANGSLLGPGFPKRLAGLGSGAVPAIADLDLDGRSEIIVTGDFWNGRSGYYDKVWVYDLAGPGPYGAIEWGQFMGGPRHRGVYAPEQVVAGIPLVVAKAGAGEGTVTSDPAGIDCGTDCSERYPFGTTVMLKAAVSAGSAFVSWDGACAGQGNPCTLTITAEVTVTANSTPLFSLNVSLTGGGSGAVSSDDAGIECGQDCSEVYVSGTTVTLTASPDAASRFVSWGGACAGQGNPCTFALTASQSVTARFDLTATLHVARWGRGTGTVTSAPGGIACGSDCSETYLRGTVVTLTAVPARNSRFVRWEGACTGQKATCTLTLTTSSSVVVRFRRR